MCGSNSGSLVVEPDDEPEREPPVRHRVDEAAAELLLPQRVAERVDHRAGRHAVRRHLPQLLDPDRELLGLRGPAPAAAARSSCLVRLPRTPSQKIVTFAWMSTPGSNVPRAFAVAADAAVAGSHADHAVAVEQHLDARRTR